MKKIIIVNNNMHIGGVQKALVNLLQCIHDKYDITLLLFNSQGEYLNEIPKDIKILSVKSDYRYLGMSKYDVKGKPIHILKRGFYAAITRVLGRKVAIGLMLLGQKDIKGYDVAISYLHNGGEKVFYGGCNEFVLKHIKAPKKVTFLHCDYEKCGANNKENAKQYEKFDLIAACSEGCKKTFISLIPNLSDKTKIIKNCHNFSNIRDKSLEESVLMDSNYINIVTVARLGKEKGVLRAVEAINKLGKIKEKIRYYIVGDGIQKLELEDLIKKYGLEDIVTLCGEKNNPFGYMKAADLLLIPSYSEAAPLVIEEAACLGTPILSTRTSSADEMITDTELGWVCDNSTDAIEKELKNLIEHSYLIREKQLYIKNIDFNNQDAITQFEVILEKQVIYYKKKMIGKQK